MKFTIIGITDSPTPHFSPEVLDAIHQGKVFSGGKRHHEIVASLLPEGAEWIDIVAPLDATLNQYHGHVVVFASGDPLFYGFANTLRRKMPDAEIELHPTFNSLQMLAHRLLLPYHDMHIVSLTGRPWDEFDRALIERRQKIGILTDRVHTPPAIASRMLEYGYTGYTMHVGEHLGNPSCEKVSSMPAEEAVDREFSHPNCIILYTPQAKPRSFGIPDSEFALLDGRGKMITKMPIRLLTLQVLGLAHKHVFWDIGFCTGSVSIEARMQFPHLHIEAFEIRRECEAIINENTRRMGAPGINIHIGDFLDTDTSHLPHPDAIFIGGHGGRLAEIMAKACEALTDGGCMVLNSVKAPLVKTDSRQMFANACEALGLQQLPPTRILLNDNHPIEILTCRK